MNSLNRDTINLKEEHQFSPEILNKDNQTGLCVCGLPQDNPLHGTMNQQNKTERWKDKLETAFYDSNPDAPDGEWFPLYQDIEKVVGELLSDARREERERCLEALPKKINKIEHWGHEIDKKFGYITDCIDCYTEVNYPTNKKPGKLHLDEIKTYISQLLSDARREERERCLEALPKDNNDIPDTSWRAGYNQAIYESRENIINKNNT